MLFTGPDNPPKLHIRMQGAQPNVMMVPWAQTSQPPKPHLDRFSHSVGLTNVWKVNMSRRAIHYLAFVIRMFGPPTWSIW